MTNEELLNAREIIVLMINGTEDVDINIEFDGAQTTPVRYALNQNSKRIQDSLESYQEMLEEITDDYDVDFPIGDLEDKPDDFQKEIDELLNQESPFEPYTISADKFMEEPSVPFELIQMLDWMIED
ncbi:hypothetical protein OSG_eHP25_00085 [environmental Halophage eHP-25]|nr:hypothetical protein OSG_eHP25_00085 [environmental Halophage eHP-25]